MTIASRELNVNNVVKELSGFDSSKWRDLGLQVDVSHSQLSTIATNVAGRADAQKEALISTVDCWLRNDMNASWEKLAIAVEKCDHAVHANKIRGSVGIVVSGKLTTCTCSYMKFMPHATTWLIAHHGIIIIFPFMLQNHYLSSILLLL